RRETVDLLLAAVQELLERRAELPQRLPPRTHRDEPAVLGGAQQRLPARLLPDTEPAEHVDQRRRRSRLPGPARELAEDRGHHPADAARARRVPARRGKPVPA